MMFPLQDADVSDSYSWWEDQQKQHLHASSSMVSSFRFLEDISDESSSDAGFNDGAILRNTFLVYGLALLFLLLLFCWLRVKYPQVYNIRNWVPKIQTSLAKDQFGYFSWIWRVYMITEDELLKECGLDALCLVRISQMGYKLTRAGILNAIWLLPLYATAEDSDETSSITDRIVRVSIANVPAGSARLIGTVVASYVVFGYAMYLILEEFAWFLEMRHKYLRQAKARNYSVLVRNIPLDNDGSRNSNATAKEFFRKCFPHEDILEARIYLQAGNLSKAEAQRNAVVSKLEHAVELYRTTGQRPMHTDSILLPVGGQLVDSIDVYQQELDTLNQDIASRMVVLEQIAASGRTTGTMSRIPPPPDVDIEGESQGMASEITEDVDSLMGGSPSTATIKDETDEKRFTLGDFVVGGAVGRSILNLSTRVKDTAVDGVQNAASNATNLASSAAALVSGGEDGQAQPTAGFVTFTKLSTTQAARQMIHHAQPFAMQVIEAPDPDDVYWPNVNRTNKDLQLGNLSSFAMTAALCLLWTIPMSFVASLSTLEALREEVGFIDDLLDAAPFLAPVFEILAPLLVVILNALLPVFLTFITLFEGPISSAMVAASLFVKLAAFMIIQTFFVSAISGGLLQELSNIMNNPASIVSLLATSLPAQATYFIQIIFVKTVIFGGMELLRVVPVVMALLRSYIGPSLTERERQTTFMGLRPLCDPAGFSHADVASQTVLYYMVFLVYAVISPITSFVIAFCFVYMGSIFRHQFVYIYPAQPDSGGKIWMNFIRILLVCLLIAEVTIIGLLALKEATIALPLFIPLLITTSLFSVYIRQVHFRVAEFLPTHECLKEDSKRHRRGVNIENGLGGLEFLRGAYKQPELAAEREVQVGVSESTSTNWPRIEQGQDMERRGTRGNTYGSGLPANVDIDATLKEAALAVIEMQNMRQGHAVLATPSPPPPDALYQDDYNGTASSPPPAASRARGVAGHHDRGAVDSEDDDANDSLSESPSSVVSSFLNSFSFSSLPTHKVNNNSRRYRHQQQPEKDHEH